MLPSVFSVGAVHDSVARPFETVVTAIANGAQRSARLHRRSPRSRCSSTCRRPRRRACRRAGPCRVERRPCRLVLNLNASVSPSASAALGTKLYGLDAFTAGVAVPEIVGARLLEPGGGGVRGSGAGGCAVPEAGADSSSPPPQPLSAAALNTINNNPGLNLRMTITPVGGNPAILEIEFRRTGGFASPPLGGFAVE